MLLTLSALLLAALQNPESGARELTIVSFPGSGQTSIQALAIDSGGNIFVSGTTNSPDFPVLHAFQPVVGEARLMASTDSGATWTPKGNPPLDVVSIAEIAPLVLVASGPAGIYKSLDGGQTWRTVYTSVLGKYQCAGPVVVDPGDHLRVAALVGDGSYASALFIRSVDGGETWAASSQRAACGNLGYIYYGLPPLLADPTGSGALMFVSDSNDLAISRDWGATFRQIPASAPVSAAAFDPSHVGSIYMSSYAEGYNSLVFSTDFGVTWTPRPVAFGLCTNITALAVDPDHSKTLVASTSRCGLSTSTDGGSTWQGGLYTGSLYGSDPLPFAILSRQCNGGGGLFTVGYLGAPVTTQVATVPDEGGTWSASLSNVINISAAGCTVYAVRQLASDAFVSKLAPDGTPLWTTFLGGSNQDVPVAIALDSQGSVYVTGNTMSPDFPVTVPPIGGPSPYSLFVTKLSASGTLLYSVLARGARATTFTLDSSQNAYIVGTANSQFPVTPGALVTQPDPNGGQGFLMKLSSDATLVYATYLGPSFTLAGGIVVDSAGQVILSGTSAIPGSTAQLSVPNAWVARLNATGTQLLSVFQFQGVWDGLYGVTGGLTSDASGNLYVLGSTRTPALIVTPGAFAAPPSSTGCPGVFVMKLRAADWPPIYASLVGPICVQQPTGALAVGGDGSVYVGAEATAGWPLKDPIARSPICTDNLIYSNESGGSALAKLGPDGSTLELGTYFDACGTPGLAVGNDGSIYVGIASHTNRSPARVLKIDPNAAFHKPRR